MTARLNAISGYAAVTAASAAASFLVLPLLTRSLGVENFGRWALVEPLQMVLSQLALLGCDYGVMKHVSSDGLAPSPTYARLARSLQPSLVAGSIVGPAILLLSGYSYLESATAGLIVYADAMVLLLLSTFRAAGSVRGYGAGLLTRNVVFLTALASTYLFSAHGLSLATVLALRLTASVAAFSFGFLFLVGAQAARAQPTHAPPGRLFSDAVSYGLPIMVTSMLAMVIEVADRYILKAFFDYASLAQYVVYLKVAAMLNPIISGPFALWWPAERFRHLKDSDGGTRFFGLVALWLLSTYLSVGGVLWLVSPTLLSWIAPAVQPSPAVILILILSVVSAGMGQPLNIGLLNVGKTHMNIYAACLGAAAHVALCFVLIPAASILGAAGATLISYFLYTAFIHYLSQRVRVVRFSYVGMATVLLASLVALSIARWIGAGPQTITNWLGSLVYLALFCPLAILTIRRAATSWAARPGVAPW